MQGWEVSDEDTTGWKLQASRPDLGVRNHAVGAYGTLGALLTLRQVLARSHAEVVVYGYIPDHRHRNVFSAE